MPSAPSLVIPGKFMDRLENGGMLILRYDSEVSENAWTLGLDLEEKGSVIIEGDSPYTLFSALLEEESNG